MHGTMLPGTGDFDPPTSFSSSTGQPRASVAMLAGGTWNAQEFAFGRRAWQAEQEQNANPPDQQDPPPAAEGGDNQRVRTNRRRPRPVNTPNRVSTGTHGAAPRRSVAAAQQVDRVVRTRRANLNYWDGEANRNT